MNNSKIALDNQDVFKEKEVDNIPILRQKEGELAKIIEAIGRISKTIDWSILEEHIFEGLVNSLERRLNQEAGKGEINEPEIYRLQGQLMWARKYADFNKLADVYRSELLNVKKQLNTNPGTEPQYAPDTYERD